MKNIFKKAFTCLLALTIASCTTNNTSPSGDSIAGPMPLQSYRINEEQSDAIALSSIRYYFAENGYDSSEAIAVQGDKEYVGIVYTDFSSNIIDEEGNCYFEAGFFQIVPNLESTTSLLLPTDTTEENPLFAVDSDGTQFVITLSVVQFESFSYIFDDWYVVVKRSGEMILEVNTFENKRANYNYDISCYSYDTNQWVFKSDEDIKDFNVTATGLYSDYTKVYLQATKMMHELIEIQNKNSELFDSSVCVVVSGELLNDNAFRNQQGMINGYYLNDLLAAQEQLKPNQSIYISPNGLEIIEDTTEEQAKMRVEKGIIGIIANALLAFGQVCIILCPFGLGPAAVAGLPIAVAIFAAVVAGVALVTYTVSNVVEGVSDIIYGAQGDIETKAVNYIKDEFAHIFGSDKAGDIAYNIWGIGLSVASALIVPTGVIFAGGKGIETLGEMTLTTLKLVGKTIADAAIVAGGSMIASYVAGEITYLITKNNVITTYVKDFTKIIVALGIGFGISCLQKKYDFVGLKKYEAMLKLKAEYGDNYVADIYNKVRAAGNDVGPELKGQALEDFRNGQSLEKYGLDPSDPYDAQIIEFVKNNGRFPSFNAQDGLQCEFAHAVDVQRIVEGILNGHISLEQGISMASNSLNGMLTSHNNHFYILHGGDFHNYTDFNIVMASRPESTFTIQSFLSMLGLA